MDGVMLLSRARDAGLAVAAKGDKLIIRGPRSAEPLALLLLDHKPEVIAALKPTKPLSESSAACLDPAWWRRHYLVRTILWRLSGYRPENRAQSIAWGELLEE
jgi:hypothetical protein